jgi:AcrR family transcriptional regulator
MPRYKQSEREQVLTSTRQYLLTAAIEEIARVGYASANINRISQAAGYAKGTIYNHFTSKEALMLEIIELLSAGHLDFIAGQVRKETHPRERLEQFFIAGFQYVKAFPAEAQLLVTTLYSPDAAFREPLGKAYQPMFRLVGQEIVAAGIAQGVFRQVEPEQAAALLMTLYLGSCSQVDQNGEPFFDPHLVAEFAYHALRDAG